MPEGDSCRVYNVGDRAEGNAQKDAFAIDEVEGDGCEINK